MNDKSAWQLVHHPQLAIISENLWLKAKARQKTIRIVTRGRYTKGRALYSQNLLTGLLKCPNCGGNLVIVSGGRYGKYGCSNNWNRGPSACINELKYQKHILEQRVIQTLMPDFSGLSCTSYLLDAVNTLLEDKTKEAEPTWQTKAIVAEMAKVEREIGNIINAIKAGIFSPTVQKNLLLLERKKVTLADRLKKSEPPSRCQAIKISKQILLAYSDTHKLVQLNTGMARNILAKLLQIA